MKIEPLCFILTPFKEKFGIPRQSLLIPEAIGVMEFEKNDFFMEAFRGIESFSHLWLLFYFHQISKSSIRPLVRPPRFLGNEKWGVFSTRSPHRPNQLGQSVVKFKNIEYTDRKIILSVQGVDMVSGTPILDIRPYLSYADSYPDAISGPFQVAPQFYPVRWGVEINLDEGIRKLIEKVIGLDPRPSFNLQAEFGVSVAGYNTRFIFGDGEFTITECSKESL